MLEKRFEFSTVDSLGNHFAEAVDVTMRGGGFSKIARAGGSAPEMERFLRDLRPDPRYQYVLIAPMGASEYYSCNSNGDYWPEASLAHNWLKDSPLSVIRELEDKFLRPHGKRIPPGNYREFGFKTFLGALRYMHHANKNPDIAYGDIPLAVWNPTMRRVEVIVRHDREKAKKVGAGDVIRDIDEGRPRHCSMGAKLPFDVCSVCGNISKTTTDYCSHLRFQMGQTLPNGKLICAYNFFPRFFDLSDVIVPAAKESGVLKKVAGARPSYVKRAAEEKRATLEKHVEPNLSHRAIRATTRREPDLPPELLEQFPLGKLLSTLALLGIVAKPREFQYGMLHRGGMPDLARSLRSSGRTFCPVHGPAAPASLSSGDFSPAIARILQSLIPQRSGFYPHLPSRIIKITVIKGPERGPSIEAGPIMDKVASAYGSYRQSLRDLPRQLDVAMAQYPDYYATNFFGNLLPHAMEKLSTLHGARSNEPLVPAYLYSAHLSAVSSPPETWLRQVSTQSPVSGLLGPSL
jgi:hypothetical protein